MVYKGMRPAREGTELREITTPRLEGAERKHFREAEEVTYGKGHLIRALLFVRRCSKLRQQRKPGKQYPHPLPSFPGPSHDSH